MQSKQMNFKVNKNNNYPSDQNNPKLVNQKNQSINTNNNKDSSQYIYSDVGEVLIDYWKPCQIRLTWLTLTLTFESENEQMAQIVEEIAKIKLYALNEIEQLSSNYSKDVLPIFFVEKNINIILNPKDKFHVTFLYEKINELNKKGSNMMLASLANYITPCSNENVNNLNYNDNCNYNNRNNLMIKDDINESNINDNSIYGDNVLISQFSKKCLNSNINSNNNEFKPHKRISHVRTKSSLIPQNTPSKNKLNNNEENNTNLTPNKDRFYNNINTVNANKNNINNNSNLKPCHTKKQSACQININSNNHFSNKNVIKINTSIDNNRSLNTSKSNAYNTPSKEANKNANKTKITPSKNNSNISSVTNVNLNNKLKNITSKHSKTTSNNVHTITDTFKQVKNINTINNGYSSINQMQRMNNNNSNMNNFISQFNNVKISEFNNQTVNKTDNSNFGIKNLIQIKPSFSSLNSNINYSQKNNNNIDTNFSLGNLNNLNNQFSQFNLNNLNNNNNTICNTEENRDEIQDQDQTLMEIIKGFNPNRPNTSKHNSVNFNNNSNNNNSNLVYNTSNLEAFLNENRKSNNTNNNLLNFNNNNNNINNNKNKLELIKEINDEDISCIYPEINNQLNNNEKQEEDINPKRKSIYQTMLNKNFQDNVQGKFLNVPGVRSLKLSEETDSLEYNRNSNTLNFNSCNSNNINFNNKNRINSTNSSCNNFQSASSKNFFMFNQSKQKNITNNNNTNNASNTNSKQNNTANSSNEAQMYPKYTKPEIVKSLSERIDNCEELIFDSYILKKCLIENDLIKEDLGAIYKNLTKTFSKTNILCEMIAILSRNFLTKSINKSLETVFNEKKHNKKYFIKANNQNSIEYCIVDIFNTFLGNNIYSREFYIKILPNYLCSVFKIDFILDLKSLIPMPLLFTMMQFHNKIFFNDAMDFNFEDEMPFVTQDIKYINVANTVKWFRNMVVEDEGLSKLNVMSSVNQLNMRLKGLDKGKIEDVVSKLGNNGNETKTNKNKDQKKEKKGKKVSVERGKEYFNDDEIKENQGSINNNNNNNNIDTDNKDSSYSQEIKDQELDVSGIKLKKSEEDNDITNIYEEDMVSDSEERLQNKQQNHIINSPSTLIKEKDDVPVSSSLQNLEISLSNIRRFNYKTFEIQDNIESFLGKNKSFTDLEDEIRISQFKFIYCLIGNKNYEMALNICDNYSQKYSETYFLNPLLYLVLAEIYSELVSIELSSTFFEKSVSYLNWMYGKNKSPLLIDSYYSFSIILLKSNHDGIYDEKIKECLNNAVELSEKIFGVNYDKGIKAKLQLLLLNLSSIENQIKNNKKKRNSDDIEDNRDNKDNEEKQNSINNINKSQEFKDKILEEVNSLLKEFSSLLDILATKGLFVEEYTYLSLLIDFITEFKKDIGVEKEIERRLLNRNQDLKSILIKYNIHI